MERNHLIDSLRFLCALLVVFIHCEYQYKSYILPITDVAVPLFFALSGYFTYGTKSWRKRIIRFLKRNPTAQELNALMLQLQRTAQDQEQYCQ